MSSNEFFHFLEIMKVVPMISSDRFNSEWKMILQFPNILLKNHSRNMIVINMLNMASDF